MQIEKSQFFIKKIAGPIEGGAAVFLGNDEKNFLIFVGWFEAVAIVKEINKQNTIRPLTHDLLHSILLGFDIEVKEVVISKIIENTFCATIILERKILDEQGNWTGKMQQVNVDARASDSLVIALKSGNPIWVTKEVYDKVENIPDLPEDASPLSEKKEEFHLDIGDMPFTTPDEKENEDDEEEP